MAVDLATLALELSTTGLARGEREASSILARLEKRLDATVMRAKAINKAINDALNMNAGAARSQQAFNQQANQFQNHQARLQQIAARNAAALQQIEARRLASIDAIRERSVQQEINRQRRVAAQQARAAQGGTFDRFLRQSGTIREAGESIQQAGAGLSFLSAQFIAVGAAAVKSAFDIDKNVNTIKAFVGSAEAAETRLKSLIALSQQTPGLTTSLATTLDAQLRAANVAEQTINRILPAIGRLNAVSPLGDPQRFAQNLQQLVTQNFERADLKELVGQSPIAGQILQQLFNVDSPTNGEAIRKAAQKLGIRTTDDFFKAFAEAAGRNQALANVTESLETRFLKLVDRVKVALRPLGLSIIRTLEPLVERAIPIVEKLGRAFDALPSSTKTAIVTIAGLTAAVGTAVFAIGALVQSIGALGGLLKAGLVIGGVPATASFGALAASILPVVGAIAAITAALGLAYVAWNKYGASANDAANTTALTGDIMKGISSIVDGLIADIQYLDGVMRKTFDAGFLISFDDVLKGTAADVAIIKDAFELLATSAVGSIKLMALGLTGTLQAALRAVGIEIQGLNEEVVRLTGDIDQLNARSNAGFSNLRATEDRIAVQESFAKMSREDQARASLFLGESFSGIPDAPNFVTRNFQAEVEARARITRPTSNTANGGRSRESALRELRAAEEQLAKAKAESLFRIEEKSLQSRLELERANYEKRLTDAQGFFENRKRIELDLLKITEQRIKGEAAASASRLNAAKDGSPEATRELAQLVELQSQLRIVEIERTDKIRELNEELEKNLKLESERNKELLAAGANAQLPLLQRTAENFIARQQSERRDPDAEFRREEIRLQVLANQGLIRESELTDALILKQRELRGLFIEQAEARKRQAEAQANQEGRFFDPREFDLEIERLQLLGSELTRAERLRKRFTDQGILDYSRLNESVEELLAEQKGITEIFADFRANIVRDQFGLIERGVDKLTERLGILGDAIGSLLKDLAKLAVSAIFRRLFGIGGGQPSFAGGGGFPAQQGGGGLLGSLVGGFGGGGGGFAPFATGGFSGGNPAQQILGGGGIGGGVPSSGILSKIPLIGKLFGGGASTSAGGASGAVSAAKTAAGIGTQAPGLAASLGAGGLLAGGGLLGSFAGGNSQFGRLLGGVGGTLLGGVVGASGLLGGGVAGALPALFSNPITAIIGGALIGGALLARFFGDREFNKFRKETDKEYQLKVDNKQAGRELYKSIKAFGEEQFGKGKFGKKIVDTIRLTKAQEQLAAYGEATGQENNPLVRKFRDRKELTDQFDPRNQFIKRAYGGDVRAFQPYIVGDAGRPEVFVPSRDGQIVPSFGDFAREVSRATAQPAQETGGAWTAEFRRVMQTMVATNARMAAALARFESMPPEQVIVTGARRAPDAITGAVNMSLSRATEAGRAMKDEVYKGR